MAAKDGGAPQVDCRRIAVSSSRSAGREAVTASDDALARGVHETRLKRAAGARAVRIRAQEPAPWAVSEADEAATNRMWRAPEAREDELVQTAGNGLTFVTIRDLKSAQPDTLGNGDLVTGFLALASAQHGNGDVKVISTGRVAQLRAGQVPTERTKRVELQAGAAKRVRRWLYPVHNPDGLGHWTLLVVDRDAAKATYYDSFGGTGATECLV